MRLGSLLFWGLLLALSVLSSPTHAQPRPLDYSVSTAFQGTVGGRTPFWHHANTRGRYRPSSTANWVSGAALRLPFRGDDGLDVSLGTEVVGRLSDARNTLHALELYGRLQYQGLRLSVGRFPETIGMNWTDLSMGSMMVSRNAPPVPKIKLSAPHFLDVPFTAGRLQVRGHWSDGRLGPHRTVGTPLLHQKSAYLKVNLGALSVIGGGIQNTVWGGDGRSSDLDDYLRAVSGKALGSDLAPTREGNTIAAYDFALQYTTERWTVRATRLFYLEDTVSMRFRSPWDGMWGLGVRRRADQGWITGLLYEHMNTIQQDALPGAPRGRVDYYNHGTYESGWTYRGAVLGNPLFVFSPEEGEITNNMILAHHLGLRGAPTPRLHYRLRLTYSRNYGVCEDQIIEGTCRVLSYDPAPPDQEVRPRGELREDQYSVVGTVRYRLSGQYGLQAVGSVATDLGSFYGSRWGVRAGLQWNGSFRVR